MEEDAEHFKHLAGISDKGGDEVEESNNTPKLVGAFDFWKSVDSKYIKMLEDPAAYKYDLDLFGYSVEDYFVSIGLIEKRK